jgi:hypothetical protein
MMTKTRSARPPADLTSSRPKEPLGFGRVLGNKEIASVTSVAFS